MPIVVAIFASIVWYVWARLIRDPGWSRRRRHLLTALYLVSVLFGMVALTAGEQAPPSAPGPLRAVWLIAFGTLFYLFLYFALVGLAKRLILFVRRRRGARLRALDGGRRSVGAAHEWRSPVGEPSIDRRQFLARATAAGVGAAATATSIVGYRNAWDVTLPEVAVRLERLPKALDGFRIVQLSDVHLGRVLTAPFLERVVELTKRHRPDAVVITGDLIEGGIATFASELEPLRKLVERYGVYYTTGNHEYYGDGGQAWVDAVTRLGVRALMNERVTLGDAHPGGASFDLAGIPDRTGGRWLASHAPDLDAALAGRAPDRELILLAHQPAQIKDVERHGVGLQLSGHTHGGQFFPFGVLARLVEPYVAGLHRHHDGTQIYVSRGTGFFGPALRTLAPAELPVIVLTT